MSATAARAARRRAAALACLAAVVAVVTVAVGLYEDGARAAARRAAPAVHRRAGTRRRRPGSLLAIPCFVGAVALVNPLLKAKPLVFAAALFALTLVLRVVALRRAATARDFDRALAVLPRGEGKNEYLPTLAAFEYGPRFVLDRFAELVPALPGALRRPPAGPRDRHALPRA